MAKFSVTVDKEVTKSYSMTIEVEADTEDEAHEKALEEANSSSDWSFLWEDEVQYRVSHTEVISDDASDEAVEDE